jgi:hypothetical protein
MGGPVLPQPFDMIDLSHVEQIEERSEAVL